MVACGQAAEDAIRQLQEQEREVMNETAAFRRDSQRAEVEGQRLAAMLSRASQDAQQMQGKADAMHAKQDMIKVGTATFCILCFKPQRTAMPSASQHAQQMQGKADAMRAKQDIFKVGTATVCDFAAAHSPFVASSLRGLPWLGHKDAQRLGMASFICTWQVYALLSSKECFPCIPVLLITQRLTEIADLRDVHSFHTKGVSKAKVQHALYHHKMSGRAPPEKQLQLAAVHRGLSDRRA